MKCGQFLKHAKNKLTIQKQVLTADSYGGNSNTWTDVAVCYAWIMPNRISERVTNEQARGEVSNKVVVRYQAILQDIKVVSSYRILLNDRIHNIRGTKNLDADMRNYGTAYIEMITVENATEVA